MAEAQGKRLVRPTDDRMIAGVCSGIARYFDLDPTLVRILWVIGTFFLALVGGILAYLVIWLIAPEA